MNFFFNNVLGDDVVVGRRNYYKMKNKREHNNQSASQPYNGFHIIVAVAAAVLCQFKDYITAAAVV